ncbi:RING-type domain-containing protein [Trichostrongylus colubriformis]|uniref:RING-type domain-containing protein n=1 Tax=Trichostrongylus colubriformis TaxID=6319 RepID=A0AAN8F8B8_TRICO
MPPAGGTEMVNISEVDDSHNMRPPIGTATKEVLLEMLRRDKEVEHDENGLVRPRIVETSEVIDPCACPANVCAIKEIVSDVVSEVIQDVPPEVKEAACASSLVCISLAGLFFSIVLYRYIWHLFFPEPEDGFFCGTFSWLFSPLFDALCERQPQGGFFHEMSHESSILYGEIRDSISNFFYSILDGFHAIGVIFSTMLDGFKGNIDEGVEELAGNASENVWFLTRFCSQLLYGITHLFTDPIYWCAHSILNILSHETHDFHEE